MNGSALLRCPLPKRGKRLINTYDIMSTVSRGERKDIFGKDKVLVVFVL